MGYIKYDDGVRFTTYLSCLKPMALGVIYQGTVNANRRGKDDKAYNQYSVSPMNVVSQICI
jgi:hypothetical protein